MNIQRKNSQWPLTLTLPPWFQENRDEIFWIINYPCTPLEFFHSGNSSVLADTTVPNTATKLLEQKHLNCGAYLCLQDTILENRSVMGKYDRNCWGQKVLSFIPVCGSKTNKLQQFMLFSTHMYISSDMRWWQYASVVVVQLRDITQGQRDEIRFVTLCHDVITRSLKTIPYPVRCKKTWRGGQNVASDKVNVNRYNTEKGRWSAKTDVTESTNTYLAERCQW